MADAVTTATSSYVPAPPFKPTPDFFSPRRPPSAVSSRAAVRGTSADAGREAATDQRASALTRGEEIARVALEASESRDRNTITLRQIAAEQELTDPGLQHVESELRFGIARSEAHQRELVLRAVEARLDSRLHDAADEITRPLLEERRREAEREFARGSAVVATLAADFLGPDATSAAVSGDAALARIISNRNRDESSPRRAVPLPAATAAPPSAMFLGDVSGGRLRWSEEKQWRIAQRSARTAIEANEAFEIDGRSSICAEEALALARLQQDGLASRFAAARAESERLEREDIATYRVRLQLEAKNPGLVYDESGRPTAESVRVLKCLLRIQRCGRAHAVRAIEILPLLNERSARRLVEAERAAAAQRIQRLARRVIAVMKFRHARMRVQALEIIRVHEERRESFVDTIQRFACTWIALKERAFREQAPHQTHVVQLQNWLAVARSRFVDDASCGDAFLLPPLARPSQPAESASTILAEVFDVARVLVSSDADLDSTEFTVHWSDFIDKVTNSRVSAVGIDAEWVGERPPALIQICDTKRCFLFRVHRISFGRLAALLQPVLTSTAVFKCGVGVKHDRKKLEGMGLGPVACLLDLVNVTAAVDLLPETGRSLELVTRAATGIPMFKKKEITVSNWEAECLSEPQQQYAADDAIAGLAILAACLEKARLLRELPPARTGRWMINDDDEVYMWLATAATMKPPPFVKPGAASNAKRVTSAGSPAPQGAAAVIAPNLPSPDDIRASDARPVYDNIIVLSIEGKHIFTCDLKKAVWYSKKKKLAQVTKTTEDGKIAEIQLNFEPAAKTKICMNWQLGGCTFGSDCLFAHGVEELVAAKGVVPLPEDDPSMGYGYDAATSLAAAAVTDAAAEAPPKYDGGPPLSPLRPGVEVIEEVCDPKLRGGIASNTEAAAAKLHSLGRSNACTICLVSGSNCSKFAVVPSYFRRHLALDLRRARSFDYVLVCSQCLPRVQATYNAERKRLWEQALRHVTADERATRLSYSTASRVYRYSEMLADPERMVDIPATRKAEIEAFLLATFPRAVAGSRSTAAEHDMSSVESIARYVLSYEIQDWTHSTEALDVIADWRQTAEARADLMGVKPSTDAVEVEWGLQFVKHWRRLFETHLRPVLVPWERATQ